MLGARAKRLSGGPVKMLPLQKMVIAAPGAKLMFQLGERERCSRAVRRPVWIVRVESKRVRRARRKRKWRPRSRGSGGIERGMRG